MTESKNSCYNPFKILDCCNEGNEPLECITLMQKLGSDHCVCHMKNNMCLILQAYWYWMRTIQDEEQRKILHRVYYNHTINDLKKYHKGKKDVYINHLYLITLQNKNFVNDFNEHGAVIIRPYKGEKTLILGCGNTPTYYSVVKKALRHDEHKDIEFYDNYEDPYHNHEGAYTIDPTLVQNPSRIGLFGYETFPDLPDHCFDRIIQEGWWFLYSFPDLCISELRRLAKPGAKIEVGFRKDDGDFFGVWINNYDDLEKY